MTLQEVNEAAEAIFEMADPDANIIFGAQIDDEMAHVHTLDHRRRHRLPWPAPAPIPSASKRKGDEAGGQNI